MRQRRGGLPRADGLAGAAPGRLVRAGGPA